MTGRNKHRERSQRSYRKTIPVELFARSSYKRQMIIESQASGGSGLFARLFSSLFRSKKRRSRREEP